jgi:copper transport protein
MSFRATTRGSIFITLAVICAALTLAWPLAPAQAHAAYKSSNPAPNSVLKTAPTEVTITFLEHPSPQGLSITVYGNKGDVVSTGNAQLSSSDPYTASVAMKGDGSDIYRVDWNNVSADDNDPTLGAFVFGVGASDKVGATTTPVTSGTSSGVSPLVAILAGIGGLVVGFLLAFVTRRNSVTPQQG